MIPVIRSSLLLWLACPFLTHAQSSIPLHELYFSYELDSLLESNALRSSGAACYYSYIGQYSKALETYDIPLEWGLDTATTGQIDTFTTRYQAMPAVAALAPALAHQELVIISEAHHKPQHRIFTRQLLPILYEQGFRYLGLETLTPSPSGDHFLLDTALQERGYPLYSPVTGFYSREPQMANLIRDALELGFEVFAYEATSRDIERDLQQAQNVQHFLAWHPGGKVVLHCGWYHAIESDYPKRKSDHYLAWHIKQLTGIDPYTIYQDALSEKVFVAESPYYAPEAAMPTVFMASDSTFFSVHHFDVLVNHGHTHYMEQRPHWLGLLPENRWVGIKKKWLRKGQYPVLIKAFRMDEPSTACPIDLYEHGDPGRKAYLVLPPGNYRIEVLDRNGKHWTFPLDVQAKSN
ncbi:MAG: hypothetical protein KDC44_22080 [Phaeodactylibacter sp.]|nr:hypothetical protein [Phaeodactylibacter sp.]